jgi:cell division GTPase FtsZ
MKRSLASHTDGEGFLGISEIDVSIVFGGQYQFQKRELLFDQFSTVYSRPIKEQIDSDITIIIDDLDSQTMIQTSNATFHWNIDPNDFGRCIMALQELEHLIYRSGIICTDTSDVIRALMEIDGTPTHFQQMKGDEILSHANNSSFLDISNGAIVILRNSGLTLEEYSRICEATDQWCTHNDVALVVGDVFDSKCNERLLTIIAR